jgi:phage baseplate assembly protein W
MAASFLNPTSQRVRATPSWYGPVLPRVTNRGAPLALVNPFAVRDPKTPGPIFPAAPSFNTAIISALNMLFGTRPGERLFLPAYGLNMEALLFEALDDTLTADAQTMLRSAVQAYVPQVQVLTIQVNKSANNNAVSFSLSMQVLGSTPNDVLTYSTPSIPTA